MFVFQATMSQSYIRPLATGTCLKRASYGTVAGRVGNPTSDYSTTARLDTDFSDAAPPHPLLQPEPANADMGKGKNYSLVPVPVSGFDCTPDARSPQLYAGCSEPPLYLATARGR